MWNVTNVECHKCGMSQMWNVTNVECHKCDTSINSDNGNQLKIFYKIPEQSTCKARNQVPTAISTAHILRKVQSIQHGK